jgi:uncharacterized membrane protein
MKTLLNIYLLFTMCVSLTFATTAIALIYTRENITVWAVWVMVFFAILTALICLYFLLTENKKG